MDDVTTVTLRVSVLAVEAVKEMRAGGDNDWSISYALVFTYIAISKRVISDRDNAKGCSDFGVRRAIKRGEYTFTHLEILEWVDVDVSLFPEAVTTLGLMREMASSDVLADYAILEMYDYYKGVSSERDAVKRGCRGITNRLYSKGFFSGFWVPETFPAFNLRAQVDL